MKLPVMLAVPLLAAAGFVRGEAVPGAVGAALDRPAVPSRAAAHAVLLGAARAGARVVAVGERGIVVLSDDNGASWRQVPTPVSITLTAVRFADKDHGYAVGHGGTVLATGDGGLTWSRRLDGRQIAQLDLAAAKASGDAAALKSAQRLVADGPDKPLLDVLVFDTKRALAIGAYGMALVTEDGGATWTSWRSRLANPKELHLYVARQRGTRIVIAGEQGLVLQSVDGGQSFARVATPYNGSFFTAELPDDQATIVAGLRGNAWRSVDRGANWTPLASPVPASITGSALRPDGAPVFVNQAGMVLGLADNALQPVTAADLPPLNFVLPLGPVRALALSIQGVQRVELRAAPARKEGTQ